ncbi:hypothetical protein PAXRUDRAFT_831034 [Paxillus rubicundulus Ve08.2h10]|uniref:Uncharacterized protein n=1 Tax=Paxillus rubicundulus Ve08.2h10 TaxID=930991 RepID=A0A0D0DJC9_9AGAM|nr:hypothetical protein PAXRUDRAFT_831034 [Paxillus rubicundulus Ve08.2h10]
MQCQGCLFALMPEYSKHLGWNDRCSSWEEGCRISLYLQFAYKNMEARSRQVAWLGKAKR